MQCRRVPVGLIVIIGLLAGLALACGASDPGRPATQRLSIATGGTGGVYYPYGGAIASIISANLPHVQATAEVTAASVDNLKLIRDRQADLAFTLADTMAEAAKGQGPFAQGGAVPVRALAVLYHNFTQIVVRDNPGIVRVADLKGKVVSVGAAGSGTEILANRLLAAAGLDAARDIVRQSLGVSQSVDQIKDGKIDAFFWSGGVPTAALLDLANTPGVRWHLLPSDDLIPALKVHGADLYAPLTIPKDAYAGMPADVAVVGVANILAVHEQMPEQLAYDITRLLFEKQAQLAQTHPEAARLSLATATIGAPAPFHAGAMRFYREKGAWKE
jgi:TRAP transporter TAXI family solute receptor